MLKPKVCRLRTSNLVGGWCMLYQLPWPAIKACEVGLLHAGRAGPHEPINIRSQGQRSRSQSAKTYRRRSSGRRELSTANPLVFSLLVTLTPVNGFCIVVGLVNNQ